VFRELEVRPRAGQRTSGRLFADAKGVSLVLSTNQPDMHT
jgi:hypothetical protein